MSRYLSDHLSPALLARLSIERAFELADRAILVLTSDEHGWPHPAMLSSLELIARDPRTIRLAPHLASRTARNLRENGRVTLVFADVDGVLYVKGDALLVASFMAADQELALFNLRVASVLQDDPADYEAARMTSGIRVARAGLDETRARAVLEELARAEIAARPDAARTV